MLPVHVPKPHPLGRHRQRIANRDVVNGIFFGLRTGCQCKALDATGLCKGSTAHSRFQEWGQAGVFARLCDEALQDYDDRIGLNFAWMALDGWLHKAPLGGKKTGPNPTDRGKGGAKRSLLTEAPGIPVGLVLEGANRHDMKLTESTLRSLPPQASGNGFFQSGFRNGVQLRGLCSPRRQRSSRTTKSAQQPRARTLILNSLQMPSSALRAAATGVRASFCHW